MIMVIMTIIITVNNLMRQWNTSHQHAQYWQKNNTYRDMIEYVLNCTLTYARKVG